MKTIPGVPEFLSKEQYMQLVEALRLVGFDVTELRSVELRMDGIYAYMKARDADGKHLVRDDKQLAEHRIYVPVRWVDVAAKPPAEQ